MSPLTPDLALAAELGLRNMLAWSLQFGLVVGAAALLTRLVHVEHPALRLRAWQSLLVLGLALPVLQRWRGAGAGVDWTIGLASAGVGTAGAPGPTPGELSAGLPLAFIVAAVLLAVVVVQLVRLGTGLARLRTIRRQARPFSEPPWIGDLRSRVAPNARFVVSDRTTSPATFGVGRPLVVLPPAFTSLPLELQRAVVVHELIHARRRDWAVLVGEELVKAVLCFHPAVHWLVGRIRLAREQCVDADVVRWLGSRRTCLESLVEVGRLTTIAAPSPTTPFLRECHLRERVELLLKEVPMTRVRSLAHLGLTAAALALAAAVAVLAFPMASPPSAEAASSSTGPEVQKRVPPTRKIHDVPVAYPEDAKAEGVQGIVLVEIRIDTAGHISEARVIASAPSMDLLQSIPDETKGSAEALRGDERLARAAVEGVRQWLYAPALDERGKPKELEGVVVTVNFKLKK